MPAKSDLPESIRELALRNGMPVRSDPDFHNDCDRLIEALDKQIAGDESMESKEFEEPEKSQDGPASAPPISRWWANLNPLVGAAAIIGVLVLGYVLWPSASAEKRVAIDQFHVEPQSITEGEEAELS